VSSTSCNNAAAIEVAPKPISEATILPQQWDGKYRLIFVVLYVLLQKHQKPTMDQFLVFFRQRLITDTSNSLYS
jgi:hypothetical protein